MQSRKRVLIVDDEEDLTWSISKHLAKDQELYDLFTANSGVKALEIMTQLPIDLVITDIRMPEISGLDLLVQIKDLYPATKVIIMTAYGSSEVHEEANRRGCLKYIEKPFEIGELRQLIIDAIKDKKGFQGQVSDFQLSDLVQLNCLGRITTALLIERDEENGMIYFDEGNIVHAEVGDLEGEDALFEILTWESGNFKSLRDKQPPRETILKGWQSLLLEGMRRFDEMKPAHKHEQEMDREMRMQNLLNQLNGIMKVKGVLLTSVFDPDGFPIASLVKPGEDQKYNMRVLSPVFSNVIKQVEAAGEELEFKQARDFIIEYNKAILKITRIPEKKEYLIILSEITDQLGKLRVEVKKYLANLAKYI